MKTTLHLFFNVYSRPVGILSKTFFKIYFSPRHFKPLILLFSFLLCACWAEAGTYYLTAVGQGNAQTPANWNTNPAGGGTAATNFTTNNDIFIIPAGIIGTWGTNSTIGSSGGSGAGVSLQVIGTLSINNGVIISLAGKNANNSSMTVSGTLNFLGNSQISLTDNDVRMTFTLSSGATLRTANTSGVLGNATCSIIKTASSLVNLSTGANYEFNGTASQATLGLPATVNTLTVNNAVGVNLTAIVTATTSLNIGNVTTNSIFNDNGNQITSAGTFNLTSGTFNIGSGATATSYPGFTTNSIAAGSTINYNSTASQTIAAVNYGHLTNTGNGPRTLASAGTIGVKGTFTPSTNPASTNTGSTIDFNGTGAQTVPAFNYNNLTVTNSNTNITLAASGTIGIAGIFLPGAVSFGTITGSSISFNGTTGAQTIPAFTFNNLTVTNTAGISSLGGNISINQSLALTNGIVSTGGNKVIIGNGGSVTRTNGWVNGYLQQYLTAIGSNIIFPIGDASSYRPLVISFSIITTPGNLTAFVTQADGLHPQIASSGLDGTKSLLRYWNLTSGGIAGTYNASFGFVAADIPVGANTGNFVVRNYTSSAWGTTTTGTVTGSSTQATGLTTFGDFAIGEKFVGPLVSTQPSSAAVCSGSNTSFTTASGSNPAPTVKWQRSTDGITWVDITATTDGSIYTNYTTNTLNITNATTTITGYQYRSVYTNINGSINSNAATLTVNILPTITSFVYAGSPFASTLNTPQSVTQTGTGSYTTGTYTFTPAGLTINSTNGDVTPNTSTVGSYTVTYTIAAAGGCSQVSANTNVAACEDITELQKEAAV